MRTPSPTELISTVFSTSVDLLFLCSLLDLGALDEDWSTLFICALESTDNSIPLTSVDLLFALPFESVSFSLFSSIPLTSVDFS